MRSERVRGLAAALCVVAALAGTSSVEADEPNETSEPLVQATNPALEAVTRELAANRLREASDALTASETSGVDPADLIAATQLRFLIDRWTDGGGIPAAAPATDSTDPANDWHVALARARGAIIAGHYEAAANRLLVLARSAPDPPWASAARHLALLAREVGKTHGARASGATELVAQVAPDGVRVAPEEPTAGSPPREHWYGWQTLITDGASLVTAPIVLGIGGYFLAAPIVHLAHHAPARAAGSLGLRIVTPIAGVLFAMSVDKKGEAAPAAGAVLGIATAIIIDAAVLAYEPRTPPKARDAPTTTASRATFAPSLSPRPEGGLDVGVGGRF